MQTIDPYDILLKAQTLGLSDNLRGSEIVFHLEALQSLLAKEQLIMKATQTATSTDDSGVEITTRILQLKYGK